MPHTQPEQLAAINTQEVAARFDSLHPIVALVSATRLMQYLEREGIQLIGHRTLCADIIRSALPSLEAGPGNDPANAPVLDSAQGMALSKTATGDGMNDGIDTTSESTSSAMSSVAAGVSEPVTVHDKHTGIAH